MLVDDPIQLGRIQPGVPGALRVHDADRTLLTDPEAIHFVPEDASLTRVGGNGLGFGVARPGRWSRGEPCRFEAILQMCPKRLCLFSWCALGIRLIGAEKDVVLRRGNREGTSDRFETFLVVHECKLEHRRLLVDGGNALRIGSVRG